MNDKLNGDQEIGAPGDREVHRHYDRARQALADGRLESARGECERALGLEADFLPAIELAGVVACQQGDLAAGIERFRRLTELTPDRPGAHFNLGNALLNAGRPREALESLERADELEPGNPGVRVSMGICRRRLGEYEAAESLLKEALEKSPRNLAALNALGATYAEQQRFEEARHVFDKAVTLQPRSPQLRHNVGNMLLELARYAEAADEFRATLTLEAHNPDARVGLATALAGQGEYDEAIHHLRRALKSDPRHGKALYGLIDSLEHENQLGEAEELLNGALAEDPDDPNLLFLKARLADRRDDSAAAADAIAAAEAAGIPDSLEARFYAEAGRVHDGAGNVDRAMLAVSRANYAMSKRWRASAPGPNAFMARVARLTKAADAGFFRSLATPGAAPATPVFLVGFPRSGTTLLGQMLDAHPQLKTVDETPALGRIADRLERQEGYPDALGDLSPEQAEELREAYRDSFAINGRLVDNMPLNLTHGGLIAALFGDAPVLFLVRDPRDVCLSCFMQSFDLNAAMANFFTLESTVRCYVAVMQLWERLRESLPLRVHQLRYEDLVEAPEPALRDLCDFLSLDWDSAMLRFQSGAGGKAIRTPSYRQVTLELYRGSIGRWRAYARYFEKVGPQLQPLVEAFGYPTTDTAAGQSADS